MEINLKHEVRRYFTVNALFSIGRALPQAILTPILVAKGLTFSDIAIVQAVFSACQLLLEFPSGILSDKIGRKWTYLASIFFMLLSYFIVYSATGFAAMCVAWGLYGVAAALQSATLDYYFAERLRANESMLRKFYANDKNIILLTSVVAALIGPTLYQHFQDSLYIFSISSMLVAFMMGCVCLPYGGTSNPAENDSSIRLRDELRVALKDSRLIIMIGILCVVEFALTPFFQLWQMVFIETKVSLQLFGVFFIASQIFNILANWIFMRIGSKTSVRRILLVVIISIGFLLIFTRDSIFSAVLLFALPLPLFLYIAEAEVALQRVIPSSLMSSVGSLAGTAGTIVSLFTLLVVSFMIPLIGVPAVLGGFLVVFVLFSTLLLFRLGRFPSYQPK
ncbi:MFS transporter [Rothia sp. P7181]|uniref:MFS transporter n=1 Tax=Rothia sp. P7181 TaxID=3402663 RepID=UPI003AEB5F01